MRPSCVARETTTKRKGHLTPVVVGTTRVHLTGDIFSENLLSETLSLFLSLSKPPVRDIHPRYRHAIARGATIRRRPQRAARSHVLSRPLGFGSLGRPEVGGGGERIIESDRQKHPRRERAV